MSNALVDALAATPGRLRGLLGALSGERARPRPGAGDWTPVDVLLHVRASDAILAPRIPQILARPGVPMADIDDRAYGDVLARAGLTVAEQVEAFGARRAELVALLRALRPEEWSATGQHELRGPITIRDLVAWIAEHEAEHLAQIEAALSATG
jgi:hypothetical protein